MTAIAEETSSNITRAAEDTIAAEIDRLRAFVAQSDDGGADLLQSGDGSFNLQSAGQEDPMQPSPEPAALTETENTQPSARSPEDEALERLEREEALAAQAEAKEEAAETTKEDKGPPNNRPPFSVALRPYLISADRSKALRLLKVCPRQWLRNTRYSCFVSLL